VALRQNTRGGKARGIEYERRKGRQLCFVELARLANRASVTMLSSPLENTDALSRGVGVLFCCVQEIGTLGCLAGALHTTHCRGASITLSIYDASSRDCAVPEGYAAFLRLLLRIFAINVNDRPSRTACLETPWVPFTIDA
jgi:hypothetical protein